MSNRARKENCGILGYRPKWLQRFATVQVFTFFACFIVAIQGIYLGYFIGIITTIEKRFKLLSKSSGALLSYYDIGHAVSVLLVGHYGFWFHKAKWIAIGGYVSCLGCFGLVLPHVLFGAFDRSEKNIFNGLNQSSADTLLCVENSSELGIYNFNNSALLTSANKTNASDCDNDNDSLIAYIILVFFQIICGIASSPFTTLTYVYIDDNASKQQSPFYFGILTAMWAYGPAIGFGLAAICTQTYVTLDSPPPGVTSVSPGWMSAWWLGLLVLSVLYFIFSTPFLFFPASLKRRRTRTFSLTQSHDSKKSVELLALKDITTASDYVREKKDLKWCLCDLARIPLEFIYFVKNPVVVTLALSWVCWAYIIGGYSTFLPKYLEAEFYQPSHKANVYGGLVASIGVATSTAIGGKILSYFNPRPYKALLLVVITGLVCFVNYLLLILIECPNVPINRMNIDELRNSLSNVSCTDSCTCNPTLFDPVCNNEDVFFSPCFAGCSIANITDNNLQYGSCACTNDGSATAGYCADPCGFKMILYLCATFVSGFIGALFQMAQFTCIIWAVPVSKKTVVLSLANFFTSVLGFMPSQVLYGSIIDTTCAIWSKSEIPQNADCQINDSTNCQIYDNTDFRVRYHLVTAMFQFLSMIFVALACYFAKNFQFHMDDDSDEEQNTNKRQDT